MTEPERIKRLTPEMLEHASQTPEHAAWIAEWRRVGAPPGSLRYVMTMFATEMNAEVARQGWPLRDALPCVDPDSPEAE